MKVFEAICLRDWEIEKNGDKQELKRGTTYIVSEPQKTSTVMVFSRFWIRAPMSIFESPVTWHELGKPGPIAELKRVVQDIVKRKK